jgi:hypothetical protein
MKLQNILRLIPLALIITLPPTLRAQFTFTTNNGAITITGYTGAGSEVIIPNTTNGLPITTIGDRAFYGSTNLASVTIGTNDTNIGQQAFRACTSLASVIIPNSVASIGEDAFDHCYGLTNLAIPNSVTNIGDYAFGGCWGLTSVTIGNGVTSIGNEVFNGCSSLSGITIPNSITNIGGKAFGGCYSLTNLIIPNSVTDIGESAFIQCFNLISVTIGNGVTSIGDLAFYSDIGSSSLMAAFFKGNAPNLGSDVFGNTVYSDPTTVYYLPGTSGWTSTFGGRPTALWFLPNPLILNSPSFGIQSNRFGFIISWATNIAVVVEACTNPAISNWSQVSTNALTNGSIYFGDPDWTNYPARFYRIRWP